MLSSIDSSENFPLNELSISLKNKSTTQIITILTTLKDDKQCSKYLLKNGALEFIVGLLSETNNQKIQNIILSILANVCLLPEARNRVRETKLVTHVLFILKNLKLSDTLQCRASRLIGNLAECNRHAKVFYDAGAISILSEILRAKTNLQTYLTSIRAIRNIWNNHYGSREEIIRNGTIKLITKILVDNDKKRLQETKYTELSKTCLKAMCAFLTTLNYQCADHMKGEKNENGYKLILEYCKDENKHAVKCFYFLSQIPECRPTLGNSGAVETMIYLLRQKSLSPEILHSLCLFSREAINRARIRSESGIVIMLEILKNSEHEKYHALLLHALAQFIFDDDSIQIMVENGLVQVLTEKLNKMIIGLPNEPEDIKTPIKRSGDTSPYRKMDTKFNRTNYGRYSMDYPRDDWSPSSATSGSSTPPSTPPYSFYDEDEADENADENYSPVCSDTEMIDDEPQEEVESLQSFSSTNVEDDQKTVKESKNIANSYTNVWTLSLLSKLSHSEKPIDKLADSTTIFPLLVYIKSTKNQKASRILSRIIKNKAYLILLIKQGFVFEVQKLYEYEQYVKQLSAIAETGGAVGDLQSTLLRSSEEHKCIAAVSIPFIIKSKKILCDLLNEHGGLEIIFQILKNNEHDLYDKAIWAVCELADTLNVKAEISDKNQSGENGFQFHEICIENSKPSTVTFELDDGTTIEACRKILCLKSDVFSAMLNGNFLESGKKRVKLKNASKDGLQTLLLAAKGAEYHDQTIESLLDAVVLADKFLMTEISEILTESSISKLNYENISRAWTWARKNSCSELKLCCIKGFLTIKMTKTQRVRSFQDFSASDNFLEFLGEIRQIISSVLCHR